MLFVEQRTNLDGGWLDRALLQPALLLRQNVDLALIIVLASILLVARVVAELMADGLVH
jgi:hypothetical protein